MKILVVVLLVVGLGVALYVNLVPGEEESPPAAPPTQAVPVWEQSLPDGVEQVPEDQVRLYVRAERRTEARTIAVVPPRAVAQARISRATLRRERIRKRARASVRSTRIEATARVSPAA